MKLKYKISIILTVIAFLYIAANYCIQICYILPAYNNIEREDSKKMLNLCKTFINDELEYIRLLCRDWANWDDSYDFIKGKNINRFIKSCLTNTILQETKLDIILFYTLKQDILWSKLSPDISNQNDSLNSLDQLLKKHNYLYKQNEPLDKQEIGILETTFGLLLVSSSPIIHSNNTGPAAGTLIMAKFLNKNLIDKFNTKLGIKFKIWPLDDINKTQLPITDKILNSLTKTDFQFTISRDKNTLFAYSLIKYPTHDQTFLISIGLPREIFKKTSRILTFSNILLIIIGIFLLLTMTELINFKVTTPLTALTYYLSKINNTKDLSNRIPILTRDNNEINYLTNEFNDMLSRTHYLVDSMEEIIKERTEEIEIAHKDTVLRLAMAVDSRDATTGNHIIRLSKYSKYLSRLIGLEEEECNEISLASTLHDVGKIGIPDAILNKNGKLTDEEYSIMKEHTNIGGNMLSGSKTKLLETAREIAAYHHERWDGTGYPKGLKGNEIPLSARITSLVDVFDALLSERPYKAAWDTEQVKSFITENSGKMFDPELVKVFLNNFSVFLKIRNMLRN